MIELCPGCHQRHEVNRQVGKDFISMDCPNISFPMSISHGGQHNLLYSGEVVEGEWTEILINWPALEDEKL